MFKENFIKLCNARGVSPTTVCRIIGLSNAAFSKWEDDSVPRRATLMKFADYFGVSVDYLLNGNSKPEEPTPTLIPIENQNVHMIPLFETVSAGFGTLAIDEVIDYIPLYFTSATEAAETICIKVRGDSMYPKIEDGDIIQVHKQDSVDSDTLAVVLLDGEDGLVKRVVYGETWLELHSINPMYKTMRFNGPDVNRVKILGAVKLIMKKP
ncbi:MAG: LexA family transcriptional regulator [Ruminococcaceae bacterium]|nr:LexA family transcriptional regulator [Oscillospiraceae bacterium]